MTIEKFKIPISMLSPTVDPAQLGFDDTSELEPLNEIIGQEQASAASMGSSPPTQPTVARHNDSLNWPKPLPNGAKAKRSRTDASSQNSRRGLHADV